MHILHLEDEGPLRDILQIALTSASPSINMQQFRDSDSALAYLNAHPQQIDLYILDIRVPGTMKGTEFAQKVRELNEDGRIVLTSAYGKPDRDFLQQINAEWMAKPWHILDAPAKLLNTKTQFSRRSFSQSRSI
jgi:DNA-binding NtrC family response regulator